MAIREDLPFEFLLPFCYHDERVNATIKMGTMRRRPAILLALAAGLIAGTRMTAMPQSVTDFIKVLPDKVDRWNKVEPPGTYTPRTLSDYIDGGAELYLSYNFKGSLAVKYKDASENEIAVDIFDMGSSYDAFGVFAHTRETNAKDFGQGSEYAAGLLTFWKGRFYVSILAYPETPASKNAVTTLGRAIEGAIKEEGPVPPILALLPEENLQPETVRYFHHYIWLNSFAFVSNENVLDIGADTPATLAKYRTPGSWLFLLLVQYPDAARAEAAARQFNEKILGGVKEGMRQVEGGRWSGIERRGRLVSVVLSAPDAASVREILAKIKE
jgi:hypothetical protein